VKTRPASPRVTVQVREEFSQVPSVTSGRVPSLLAVSMAEQVTGVVSMVPGWMTPKE
jgi:hypothetical protein